MNFMLSSNIAMQYLGVILCIK